MTKYVSDFRLFVLMFDFLLLGSSFKASWGTISSQHNIMEDVCGLPAPSPVFNSRHFWYGILTNHCCRKAYWLVISYRPTSIIITWIIVVLSQGLFVVGHQFSPSLQL